MKEALAEAVEFRSRGRISPIPSSPRKRAIQYTQRLKIEYWIARLRGQ